LHAVDLEVAPAHLEVAGIGLDEHEPRACQRVREPQRVVRPEAAELDQDGCRRRIRAQPLDEDSNAASSCGSWMAAQGG